MTMAKRSNADQPANAGPEAILPVTDFRADPWGTGNDNAVAFKAGIVSSPVPADFAQRMRDEGKAAGPKSIATTIAADTVTDQPEQD